MDIFKLMELVGIQKEDTLYCLDLVQFAKSEVMRIRFAKDKI